MKRGFVAEYKSVATPKNVEVAIQQAKKQARSSMGRLPMILVPYISKETEKRLIEEQVSGLDFSGNALVVVPGELIIRQTGNPNRFPSSQTIKNVYEGKSALVGRVLFCRPQFSKVQDVRDEIIRRGGEISLATVSKVLSSLEDDLIITKKEGVQLIQPERLLDLLVQEYKGPRIKRRLLGKSPDNKAFLESIVAAAPEGVRFTGLSEALYVLSPQSDEVTRVYVSTMGDWVGRVSIQEVSRFANVELVEVERGEVFFDTTPHGGFPWCSKLQIYLELMQGGKREREVAAQLRREILAVSMA
ncbi:MAG: hypothetical protein SH809_09435 [Rhodothermales bacterium]|nr:hypothetical protein [Rhodothermales bacterium]